MARPRKQTYTMDMYLKKMRDGDICNNADVQRQFAWNNEQINELIVTVLMDDYIPPIILGEENNAQLHIADGGCRSAALEKFRYGNYKITSTMENSLIPYKKKTKDSKGRVVWEDAVFDIKKMTYEKLPDELKKKFDEYQIETIIHENCDRYKISKYIKRYNNHVSMNTNQKAFTYLYNFAGYIREILDSRFFLDYSVYTDPEKNKGVVERVVVETIMCSNYLEHWKKQTKAVCKFLNDNGKKEEFRKFEKNLHRLEHVITEDIKDIFNSKDSFLFLTLFDRFTKLKLEDDRFADFLRVFKGKLRGERKNENGLLFDEIDKDKGTKDKVVVVAKLAMLEDLLYEFLKVPEQEAIEADILDFVRKLVNPDATKEDMEDYEKVLDAYVRIDAPIRKSQNLPSLIAMIAYGYQTDTDVEMKQWFFDFVKKHKTFQMDQKKNYQYMKADFMKYMGKAGAA